MGQTVVISKTLCVLLAIEEIRDITPRGRDVYLNPKHVEDRTGVTRTELLNALIKFQDDAKILIITRRPGRIYTTSEEDYDALDCYCVKLLPGYPEFFRNAVAEHDRRNAAVKSAEKSETKPTVQRRGLWISFSENTREIVLNDYFLLSRPHFGGENEMVFSYLFKNQGKRISLKELEREATKMPLKKRIHEILKDLGFKGELAKAFFSISKTGVIFQNPVTPEQMKDLEITKLRIGILTKSVS